MSITPVATTPPAPVPTTGARHLIAWMTDQTGLAVLLGHPPLPGEDITAAEGRIAAARAARDARPVFAPADPRVPGDPATIAAIAARADLVTTFHPFVPEPAFVDLRHLQSIQQLIRLQGLEERVAGATTPEALRELCLPSTNEATEMSYGPDPDGRGVVISSANPNLRVLGSGLATIPVSPGVVHHAVQILFAVPTSHLHVAEYHGRYFLRDGYHRAAALVHAGIFVVPTVLLHLPTYADLAGNPGLFSEAITFSERPPLLVDFWDDEVAEVGHTTAPRKFIRVRGDEFNH